MSDINCPYCNHGQEVCHDDGQGYEEDYFHEMQCYECDKHFTFLTSISFYYEPAKADCLNGSDHDFQPTRTHPKFRTKMQCRDCEKRRDLTDQEWLYFMEPLEVITGYGF